MPNSTRLSLPPDLHGFLPGRYYLRPRLLESLAGGLSKRLTLLTAPPGFGKTALLMDWVSHPGMHRLPVAWLSLQADDAEPQHFWSHLRVAMRKAFLPEDLEPFVRHPDDPSNLAEHLAILVNQLDARFRQDFVLILDDYHCLTSTSNTDPFDVAIAYLLAFAPTNFHLVIASRAEPQLPLSHFRARGDLLELRAVDLRFTPGEVRAWLGESIEQSFPDDVIERLLVAWEGWAVAIEIGMRVLQSSQDPLGWAEDLPTRGDPTLSAYMADQVFNPQPLPLQEFLMRTAVLETLCGPLCDYLLENGGSKEGQGSPPTDQEFTTPSQTMLDLLVRKNLLLFPLDNDRGWFRYHPLFAGFLRRHLDEHFPGLSAGLSQRAATWFAGHAPHPLAVIHLEKEPDPGALVPTATPDDPMTDPSKILPGLSQREREVLDLIEAGLTYRQIADKMVVSMGTVQTHVKHLYAKLGAHSAPEAVSRARHLGLLR